MAIKVEDKNLDYELGKAYRRVGRYAEARAQLEAVVGPALKPVAGEAA